MTTAQFPSTPGSGRPGDQSSTQDSGVKDQAQNVAGTAADEGKHVAGTAKDEASKVASEAKSQVQTLLSEATSQVQDQSRAQKDRLAETVRTFSSDLESMAGQSSGLAAEVAQQVADKARSLSSHLEGREPTDLLEDVRGFARRRPGAFLLGALAAGMVAGRLTKGAKEANDQQDGYPQQRQTSLQGGVPPVTGTSTWSGSTDQPAAPTYGSPGVTAPPAAPGGGTPGYPAATPPATGDPLRGSQS